MFLNWLKCQILLSISKSKSFWLSVISWGMSEFGLRIRIQPNELRVPPLTKEVDFLTANQNFLLLKKKVFFTMICYLSLRKALSFWADSQLYIGLPPFQNVLVHIWHLYGTLKFLHHPFLWLKSCFFGKLRNDLKGFKYVYGQIQNNLRYLWNFYINVY